MFSIFASLRLPAYSDFLQKKQRLHHPLSVNDAADLSLHRVIVLDSGFAALRFHKCALMVNNFIEFAHFCQYIFFIHTDVI